MARLLDLTNAQARLIRSLQSPRVRRQERSYLAEGERLVAELAGSGAEIRLLVGMADRVTFLERLFPDREIAVARQSHHSLFPTESTQGVLAVVAMAPAPDAASLLDRPGPLLYLDRLADPGNLGTILRSIDWFGGAGLLLSAGSVDPYNSKCVRASMGGIFRVPVCQEVVIADLRASGREMLALDSGGDRLLGAGPIPERGIYVVGNEAHGLGEAFATTPRLAIPGGGGGESLNAAIAASILLYELLG